MLNCNVCGGEFKEKKGKANKYCSLDCYREFQRSGNYTIEANRTIKPEPCFHCGDYVVRFKSTKRNGERSDKVFCSRDCYDAMRSSNRKEREMTCKQCGDWFIPNNKDSVYCSMKCRNKSVTVDCTTTCKSCKSLFSAIQYRSSGSYIKQKSRVTCSENCRIDLIRNDKERKVKISAAFKGNKHPMWRGGVSKERQSRGSMWSDVRKECLSTHGYACVECGMTNKESKEEYNTSLHVDHIKPWHEFDNELLANSQSNLRPLCISCHGKHGSKVRHGMYKKKNTNRIPAIVSKAGISLEMMIYISRNYKTNGVSWSNISEIHKKTGVTKYLIRTIGNGSHPICKYLNDDKKLFDYIESLQKK